MILPSFITRIISAVWMVDRRCATIKLVRPSIIFANAFWIFSSVRVSMEEVASSKINIGGRQSITRAMHSSCFCPCDKLPPSSPISVSYPCGRRLIKLCACAAFAAAMISSSLAPGFPIARFSRIVPAFSQVSCSTMPKLVRRLARVASRISVPLTLILPEFTS